MLFRSKSDVNSYICNLNIYSVEFSNSSKIIKYYLEKILEVSSYQNAICNMINLSYEIENYNMIKFLLSLSGAREGISELLIDKLFTGYDIFDSLCNRSTDESINLEYQKTFSNDIEQCKNFILYDFLIDNLPNGIDISIINRNILNISKVNCSLKINIIDRNTYSKYLYIINRYIKYFECSKGYENSNDKYYCNREALTNM